MTKPTTIFIFLIISLISSVCYGAEIKKIIRSDCTGYDDCYTSLEDCMNSNEQDLTDNGGDYFLAEIQEGFQDTTAVIIDGWTTSADNYIHIYTTTAARHNGTISSGYKISCGSTSVITIAADTFITIEGLIINLNNPSADAYHGIQANANSIDATIRDNIIYASSVAGNRQNNSGIFAGYNYGLFKIYNNIFYNFSGTYDDTLRALRLWGDFNTNLKKVRP